MRAPFFYGLLAAGLLVILAQISRNNAPDHAVPPAGSSVSISGEHRDADPPASPVPYESMAQPSPALPALHLPAATASLSSDDCALRQAPAAVVAYAQARKRLQLAAARRYSSQPLPSRPGSSSPTVAGRLSTFTQDIRSLDKSLAGQFTPDAVARYKKYMARCGDRAFHD
jgi:hypothetical protein